MQEINTIGVIGIGTMGSGIAQTFAENGYDVICCDISDYIIKRGLDRVRLNQGVLIENGVLKNENANFAFKRIETTIALNDLAGVDFICEAVTEDMDVKKKVFSEINNICRKKIILTSNTSGLSITEIASVVSNPQRFIGMHWWNPPHIIPLVEVIKGDKSSEETCMTVMNICKKMNKKPVLVQKDMPGFIGNRLQMALLREVMHILETGAATAEDIDAVIKYGPGARWALYGPCELMDLGGLDVFNSIFSYLFRDLSNAADSPALMREKAAKGELGTKTGKGLYEYTEDEIKELIDNRDKMLLKIFDLQKQK